MLLFISIDFPNRVLEGTCLRKGDPAFMSDLRDDYLSVNQAESQVASGILRTGILRRDPPL